MSANVEGEGFREDLLSLNGHVQFAVLAALAASADYAQAQAEKTRLFKDRTGNLRASFFREVDVMKYRVRLGNRAKYAAYVELGTRPHVIEARRRRFLRFKMNGRFVFRRRVNHPGTKRRPFLREAADDGVKFFLRDVEGRLDALFEKR